MTALTCIRRRPIDCQLWEKERNGRDTAREVIRVLMGRGRLEVLLRVGDRGSETVGQLVTFIGDDARRAVLSLTRAGLVSLDGRENNARCLLTSMGRRAYLASRALVR